jgi:Zn-dependent M28 family amino/carboxypeptidase
MAFFFAAGPLLRTPSVGALDNGGSVVALLRLAERLAQRPAGAPTTVRLVFFASEEERGLGSWHYAGRLARDGAGPVAVINLEGIGTSARLTYAPEDGFELRRYASPGELTSLLETVARAAGLPPPEHHALPPGTFTDGRSFLAHGIPAVTLRGHTDEGFPRHLHSWRDSRDRVSPASIDQTVEFLAALVSHVDARPEALTTLD